MYNHPPHGCKGTEADIRHERKERDQNTIAQDGLMPSLVSRLGAQPKHQEPLHWSQSPRREWGMGGLYLPCALPLEP